MQNLAKHVYQVRIFRTGEVIRGYWTEAEARACQNGFFEAHRQLRVKAPTLQIKKVLHSMRSDVTQP